MKVHEYLLERRGSPLHLCYSTPSQNPATIVPVLYFLTAAHGQVRLYISTRSVVSRCCWKSRTSPIATMLQKLATMFVLSFWLKSRPRDLVCWHRKLFSHETSSIHCMNAHLPSSFMSYPGSKRGEPKLPYMCPGCSNHTYGQQ
jgi:hypothetical protein